MSLVRVRARLCWRARVNVSGRLVRSDGKGVEERTEANIPCGCLPFGRGAKKADHKDKAPGHAAGKAIVTETVRSHDHATEAVRCMGGAGGQGRGAMGCERPALTRT